MNRIFEIFHQSIKILRKRHLALKKRISLLRAFLGLAAKRFMVGRVPWVDETNVKFLNYRVKVGEFSDFYWTFVEVFLEEDYFFDNTLDRPFIIDCGANIGISTLYFKWLYPNAEILAFEIEPDNLNILHHNLKENVIEGVTVIEKAVGLKPGTVVLRGNRRAGTISETFIKEQSKKDNTYKDYEVEVEIVPLSRYVDKKVDFLKMDIEGAESDVFYELGKSGAIRNIGKTTFEYHRFSSTENRLSTILAVLEENNYDVIFPQNYEQLSDIRRRYYNFMIRAGKPS